jgi:hypothetical protein
MDWQRDESLDSWISAADWLRRHQAASLALRRLRAPLLDIEMPAEWGIDRRLVESLFDILASWPSDSVQNIISDIRMAPLFESEVYPTLAEEVQLEAIGGLLDFGDSHRDLDVKTTGRIITIARGMAHYLDQLFADSLTLDPLEDAHRGYVSQLDASVAAYAMDYYGSRNIKVEFDCRDVIDRWPDGEGMFTTPSGRELLQLCDEFSAELVSGIRQFDSPTIDEAEIRASTVLLKSRTSTELSGEAGAAGGEVCLLGGRCIQVPTCGRRGACPLRPVTT